MRKPARGGAKETSGRGLQLLLVGAFAAFLGACGGKEALGMGALSVVSEGVVNDPSNKSLRFDILKFGLERLCDEMRSRGAPIKMHDQEPMLGRFFAHSCQSRVIDEPRRQSVVVHYSGEGYGWTNVTQRIGFRSTGLIEYATDFQLYESKLYVYFRPRSVGSASFELSMVESPLAQLGMSLSGVNATAIGQDLISKQLQRGFTVIRQSENGETDFSLGIIPLGHQPFHPFQVRGGEAITLENERTELQPGQQDFVRGLRADDNMRLKLTFHTDGASAVDVAVVRDSDALQMLKSYVQRPGPAGLVSQPIMTTSVMRGQPAELDVRLPAGHYALVFDHSAALGRVQPGPGEPAAKIDYLVRRAE